MKNWEESALATLRKSLFPVKQELNELDWKVALSEDSKKLTQHLSAFSNYRGGGFLVFGVSNDGIVGINKEECNEIVKKMGNIARDALRPNIRIDHAVLPFEGASLLFVFMPESDEKPVHFRRGTIYDSYIRSAGQTRKMTRQETALCISQSHHRFEEGLVCRDLSSDEVLRKIDFSRYFDLLNRNLPDSKFEILDILEKERLIKKENRLYYITSLGAVLFAKNLEEFNELNRKALRIILYDGVNKLKTIKEEQRRRGYAIDFEDAINYISNLLPVNEMIGQAMRREVKMYPQLAIRELVANALIHQDFYAIGTGPMVEIFSDRIEITNPGKPLIDTMRFIDYPPKSRNEILASLMRRVKICEERGSGIDKVIFQVELYQLPAPSFVATGEHLKATLYASKPLAKMNKNDRIRACYQHCCLKCVSNEKMSNQTLRKRFNISDKNYPMASRIIADTIREGLIKADKSESKRCYIPFWA